MNSETELNSEMGHDESYTAHHWNLFTAAKNRLASSLDSNPGVLDRLARRLNASVQERVAENTSTDSCTLHLLAQHESSDVRAAAAQNENALQSTVDVLAGDASCDVRYAMAENPLTCAKLLEALAEDENPFVQNRAQVTQARLKAEETLRSDQGFC